MRGGEEPGNGGGVRGGDERRDEREEVRRAQRGSEQEMSGQAKRGEICEIKILKCTEKEGDMAKNERGIERGRSGEAGGKVREGRGEAAACLPPIHMWNNGRLSVCQHLQAQRE